MGQPDPGVVSKPQMRTATPPINLADEESFLCHPWVEKLVPRFFRDSTLARHAMHRITEDIQALNAEHIVKHGRAFFTTIDGRVKSQTSFFRKLHAICKQRSATTGVTPQTLDAFYDEIKDLCGVRFACPYYDEIAPAIQHVRESLGEAGYVTEVGELPDRNYLDAGDARGYRSYHFYLKVPTETSIFGDVDLCLCEVQVRSELQHVWAVKSHDLLYKPEAGWQVGDRHVVEDMKQLSNSLRAADQSLISIRDRAKGEK